MTDRLHQTDHTQHTGHTWTDAEALVQKVERAAQSDLSPAVFFDDLVAALKLTTQASSAVLWVLEKQSVSILARSGVSIHQWREQPEPDAIPSDRAAASRWSEPDQAGATELCTIQRVDSQVVIGIGQRFDSQPDLTLQRNLSDLSEVVLNFASQVFVRDQFSKLRARLDARGDRDTLIGHMNQGANLVDSCAHIASAIASRGSVDRVGILSWSHNRYRLLATSARAIVDRRARQVRLLEQLCTDALRVGNASYHFHVGRPDTDPSHVNQARDSYLDESGCREIFIVVVRSDEQSTENRSQPPVAAIVMERFRAEDSAEPLEQLFESIRQPVVDAVSNAMARDQVAWGKVVHGLGHRKRNWWKALAIGSAAMLLACFLPVTLKIPAEGTVVAAERSRLFAPAEGIVAEVPVMNGQRVHAGDTLLVLQSPELDLQLRNLQAELSTARTQLSSLLALRSKRGGASRDLDANRSAEERALKTEIAGLQSQLELVQRQQAELVVKSPIDGQVDRWDIQRSLAARPVTHGQHLVDVIAPDKGWTAELDLPDKHIMYVRGENAQGRRCLLRLRSDPTVVHEAAIAEISEVAHLNRQGQSMIRILVPLQWGAADAIRSGATVSAQIHCDKRPLGFIWFRALIEWSRSQVWL